ncbi:MAG: MerR family transcriptional regulator [Propionibacteriaceae bacterium]|nr:MerR family transcriptional regulator [Propionibacteriaceae bacterium]
MLIGDFARLGQVSVRMLRHYDQIGLLSPDSVDPWSSYRSYSPEQLSVLNRIVALKDLGLSLDQVGHVLADRLTVEELRGMLRLCHAKVEEEMRVASTRLAAVESRLRMIEKEDAMSTDYVVKPVEAVRLAALSGNLDPTVLETHIGPMFDSVATKLTAVHASLATAIATYAEVEGGMDVVVGYAHDGDAPEGLEIVDLPAATAVCGVHLGPMSRINESWQGVHRWLVENNYDYDGPCRELYVRAESEDQQDWVTELQQPVRQRT